MKPGDGDDAVRRKGVGVGKGEVTYTSWTIRRTANSSSDGNEDMVESVDMDTIERWQW